MKPIFDPELRLKRRERAARCGPELLLAERAFADIVAQLSILPSRPARALMIGSVDPDFTLRLGAVVDQVEAVDPSPWLAAISGAKVAAETDLELSPASFDVIIAFGTLDTIDDLPAVLRHLASALSPGGMLTGFMPGGDTLPRLRQAMQAADRVTGGATPRVHPRIEPQALTGLLAAAGLANPVVEVDRIELRYAAFGKLVADLRAMGATNILRERSRTPLGKLGLAAAIADFGASPTKRTTETVELLHFAAWKPTSTGGTKR